MRYLPFIASFAFMAGSTVAGAQGPAGVASPVSPAATVAPKAAKIICHTEDTVGSRLGGHRECHTAAEWNTMRHDNADDMDQRLRNQRLTPGG